MAALKITPGLISKLTTSLNSAWFRCANPSATSHMLLSRGYGTDVVLGKWAIESKQSWLEMATELGVPEGVIARNANSNYVVKYTKDGDGFRVSEQITNGYPLEYKVSANGEYDKPMPLYSILMTCTAKFKDNGIHEHCTAYHFRTGQEITLLSDRYVENGKLKEKVQHDKNTMLMSFRKL